VILLNNVYEKGDPAGDDLESKYFLSYKFNGMKLIKVDDNSNMRFTADFLYSMNKDPNVPNYLYKDDDYYYFEYIEEDPRPRVNSILISNYIKDHGMFTSYFRLIDSDIRNFVVRNNIVYYIDLKWIILNTNDFSLPHKQ